VRTSSAYPAIPLQNIWDYGSIPSLPSLACSFTALFWLLQKQNVISLSYLQYSLERKQALRVLRAINIFCLREVETGWKKDKVAGSRTKKCISGLATGNSFLCFICKYGDRNKPQKHLWELSCLAPAEMEAMWSCLLSVRAQAMLPPGRGMAQPEGFSDAKKFWL